MKKLVSKSEQKKKQKRNQLIIGLILIFVMFGSVFGIIVNSFGKDSSNENVNYNQYEFINQNGVWYVDMGDYYFAFKYNPTEVNETGDNLNFLTNYYNKPLYLKSDNYEAALEIYQNLNQFVERMQEACVSENDCEGDLPIKDCSNNFIIIREASENKITQQENCVYIEGKEEDLVKLTDSFLLTITGLQ